MCDEATAVFPLALHVVRLVLRACQGRWYATYGQADDVGPTSQRTTASALDIDERDGHDDISAAAT